ncbi:MAG TPA: hypothetical protein VL523_08650 [Terriglobia bacterium]|nr:hypothetical protein [Terriglobia bacterium]
MQKRFLSTAASAILVFGLACGLAAAQDTPQGNPPPPAQAGQVGPRGRMGGGPRMTPDEQLQRMSERLNLTEDQKSQIKPMLEDRQKQMESLRADTSLSQEDRRAKMHSMMQDFHTKVSAVLTDEQKQKFEEMQQRQGRGRGGMRGQQGAPGAAGTPPPPPPQ